MSAGPVQRAMGAVGLVALAPTAVMLVTEAITPADAAVRAVATVAGILLLSRLVDLWFRSVAGSLEREAERAAEERPADHPQRRRTDRAATSAS
ncbi:MAG TPA: hypothetical protein VIK95_11555 [Egibacteraceae bacterium]